MNILIDIENKHAKVLGSPVIVCGNSNYTIKFTFDSEWSNLTTKTARFVYVQNGKVKYTDVVFTGDIVDVPLLSNVKEVRVGVYSGALHTTTPALIPCERSIRCGTGAPEDPTPSQYDQIISLINDTDLGLTLGIHTDGLIYIFKDGVPIGEGLQLTAGGGENNPGGEDETTIPENALLSADGYFLTDTNGVCLTSAVKV